MRASKVQEPCLANMDPEPENQTTESFNSDPARQAVDPGAIFDPAAMLRELTLGEDAKGPKAPDPKPKAPKPQPAAEEEPEEETEGQGEGENEGNDEDTDDGDDATVATPESVIKNPEAFAKAHEEMKAKSAKRDAAFNEVRELLGAKDASEVKTRLEELRELAAVQEIPVTAPTPARPLSNVRSEKEMAAAVDYWQKQLDWCAENPNGGTYTFTRDGKPVEKEVDAAWVKGQREFAVRVITRDVPARRKFLEELRTETARANAVYPFYAPNAAEALTQPLHDLITDLDKHVPEFSHYPRLAELLGDATIGRLVRSGKYGITAKDGKLQVLSLTGNGKAPAAKAPVRKTPPVTTKASVPPGRKATPQDDAAEQAAAALRSGDRESAFRGMILQQIQAAG